MSLSLSSFLSVFASSATSEDKRPTSAQHLFPSTAHVNIIRFVSHFHVPFADGSVARGSTLEVMYNGSYAGHATHIAFVVDRGALAESVPCGDGGASMHCTTCGDDERWVKSTTWTVGHDWLVLNTVCTLLQCTRIHEPLTFFFLVDRQIRARIIGVRVTMRAHVQPSPSSPLPPLPHYYYYHHRR